MEDRALRGKRGNLLLFLMILISITTFFSTCHLRRITLEESFLLTINVTYENRSLNETWFLSESDFSLSLFMNSSWQEVYLVSLSHPINRVYIDPDGNRIVVLDIGREIPPGDKISYNVTYRLIYKDRKLPIISEEESGSIDDIPQELREKYCEPTSLWNFNITMLREAAHRIAGDEKRVLTILKKFIRWISENIRYATSEVPRYPNETLSQRMGDCDDQANLLITLCRAVGIPAYLQLGCIYMPWVNSSYTYWSGRLLIKEMRVGWHGWAIVYVPPWGWLPVDLTYVIADLRRDPLSAIMHSAMIEHYTFHYANIVITDYISESRSLKEFLESKEFYIYEEDIMEREFREKVIYPQLPIIVYSAILYLKLVEIIAPHRRLLQNANNLYIF